MPRAYRCIIRAGISATQQFLDEIVIVQFLGFAQIRNIFEKRFLVHLFRSLRVAKWYSSFC